jgi:asparagine synthase (glutamine-hydrolysing)
MQYTDMVTSLREQLLVKADRMLMAHGIEGRVPLLDHRVVELGLALPDHLKVRGRTGKVLLRAWAQDATGVPYSRMRKRGFGAPIGQELCGRRLDQLEQVVPANVGVRRWIRGDGLRGMFSRQRHRGDAGRVLVAVLQFALWHRLHVEFPGQCPADRQDPVEVLA